MSNINDNTLKQNTILYGKSHTYTIERVLGQGSFGITYLAMTQVKVSGALGELETTIQVAIKEFFMRDINGREENTVTCGSRGGVYYDYKKKFLREAENLSKLNHPHIVKVLEYFEANNTVYYAMEYVDGGTLDTYIAQHKSLTEAESIEYAKQIGSALSYMHAHKMLHLDLKPGNIMLRKNKEAVLIDFGLSKQYDENGKPETSTTVGSGTPGYAPIEQSNYHEGKDFPATMDVYALGATMYKMLTGIRPPEASEILNDGFPAYELQKHQVSDSLIASIAKVMSAMKKDRPQSVAAFLETLGNKNTKVTFENDENTISTDANYILTDNIPVRESRKKQKGIMLMLATILVLAVAIAYSVSKSGGSTGKDAPSQTELFAKTVKAAEAGNAEAQFELGNMYFYGRNGTPINNPLALTWYQKAAEQGYAAAQFAMGQMYAIGFTVPKDMSEAVKWYQKAAEQGHMEAIQKLALYYEGGNVENYSEAAKWYQKAVEQGDMSAMYTVGRCYEKAQNDAEAVRWYRKAAEQGIANAQWKLGHLYQYGSLGISEDKAEAIKWYRKAAEQGDEFAKKCLQKLENK